MIRTPHHVRDLDNILKREFPDQAMLVYATNDPFREFLNLTVAHESEEMKYMMTNDVAYSFNPQTCNLNEEPFSYSIPYDYKTTHQPITMSGVAGEETVPIIVVNQVEDFYSYMPTRLAYDQTYVLDTGYSPLGIIWQHSKYDRTGEYAVLYDRLPSETGTIIKYDNDFVETEQSQLARIDTYSTYAYRISDEDWDWDDDRYTGTFTIPWFAITDTIRLYDFAHLNHSGLPIEVDQSEYTVVPQTGTPLIVLNTCTESGRTTYNPDYYDSPNETGQPDKYWNGEYGITFSYTAFTGLSNGLATYGYFHELPSMDIDVLLPCSPMSTGVNVPFQNAVTQSTDDELLIRVTPKYIRPGQTGIFDIYFTKYVEESWADLESDFTYTISDGYFYETADEAIKVFAGDIPILVTGTTSGADITIPAMSGDQLTAYGRASITVGIYYKVHYTLSLTGVASYTYDSINYADDYMYNDTGNLIPYTVFSIDIEGIDESYAYPTITLSTNYEFHGLAYDPYRRVFWSFENNNKYLSARDPKTMNLMTNISLFKEPKLLNITLNDNKVRLVDYTITDAKDIVSLKYMDRYFYFLTSDSYLYMLDAFDDLTNWDFNIDVDGNISPVPFLLADNPAQSGNIIDFTFNKRMNLAVLYDNGEVDTYNAYRDYALVDSTQSSVYFRYPYSNVTYFDRTPIGNNRITDLDQCAITYFNELRYPGETLHSFYDRLAKRYLPILEETRGINSTKQGMYNAFATMFNLTPYKISAPMFFYLDKQPAEWDPETGDWLSISASGDLGALTRYGSHADNPYETGVSGYVFGNTYKYTSMFDDLPNSGFILWRNYDGTYGQIIEINAPYCTGISVSYCYLRDDGTVKRIEQLIEIDYPADSGTSEYDIIPISESFLYNSGIMQTGAIYPIREYASVVKRHWGYFKLDETIMATKNYEQRNELICYDVINTGITGGF